MQFCCILKLTRNLFLKIIIFKTNLKHNQKIASSESEKWSFKGGVVGLKHKSWITALLSLNWEEERLGMFYNINVDTDKWQIFFYSFARFRPIFHAVLLFYVARNIDNK